MGHNPRYARWTDADWRGYAPTIARMADQGWSIAAHCEACCLVIDLKTSTLAARHGRDWSPWGATYRCVRRGCIGTAHLRARNGRAEREIWLVDAD